MNHTLSDRLIIWTGLAGIFGAWAAIWVWLGPAVLFTLAAMVIVAGLVFFVIIAWIASVVA